MSAATKRCDLVVAGAGAAGMVGALVAARAGLTVTLLERDYDGPSNFRVSGGLFPVAGSRFQTAAGIVDSPAAWAADIRAKALGAANEAIVDAIAAASVDVLDFFVDVLGLSIHLAATVPAPGHAVHRLHASPKESGRDLHDLLRAVLEAESRITIRRDGAESLVVEAGRAAGIRAGGTDVRAGAVLLASGGFAASPDLVAEYIPAMAGALHIGAGANDGVAIRWGRALGADVAMMDGYQGQGHVNPGGRTRLGMGLPLLGSFIVNARGERFVREDVGPSELASFVLGQPGGRAVEIFDARCHEAAGRQGPYQQAVAAGAVQPAPDLATLAARFDLPPATLEATFADYDAAVRGVRADPLGRTRFGPPLAPPFHAGWVTGALAHTQGGLRVDAGARVVRADGTPIPGLYAAGGAAASLAGQGGEGYLPGNGLGQSFGLAWLGARAIAAR